MKKRRGREGESGCGQKWDFSKGLRGKYAKRFEACSNVVVLSPDVAKVFPNSDSVNEALRALARIAHRTVKP